MNKEQTRRLNDISYEIDEWASLNFKIHQPKVGILEEVGELAHCILKRWQRIRGFEDYEFFVNKSKDALGDIAVYTLHDLRLESLLIMEVEECVEDPLSEDQRDEISEMLGELGSAAGLNLEGIEIFETSEIHEAIFNKLEAFSQRLFNTGILDILEEVWAEVKQRDWNKNPNNADNVKNELE